MLEKLSTSSPSQEYPVEGQKNVAAQAAAAIAEDLYSHDGGLLGNASVEAGDRAGAVGTVAMDVERAASGGIGAVRADLARPRDAACELSASLAPRAARHVARNLVELRVGAVDPGIEHVDPGVAAGHVIVGVFMGGRGGMQSPCHTCKGLIEGFEDVWARRIITLYL